MAGDFFLYCEQRTYYPHDGQDARLCLPWHRHGSLRSFRNSWKLLPLPSCDFLEISLPTRAHLPVHRSQSLCESPDGIITHKSGDPSGLRRPLSQGPKNGYSGASWLITERCKVPLVAKVLAVPSACAVATASSPAAVVKVPPASCTSGTSAAISWSAT